MVDIIIVGSGPAGMSAAVYGKRAGLSVLVIEKVYYGTGQVAESSHVDNYLGIPGINGYELGEKFRSHAEGLDVEIARFLIIFSKKLNPAAVALAHGV